ncbi:hypothetical protein HPB51_029605 [Rhipicephalus microplus]|uniref:Uncharacterized protein n=1 Tax=Rhipicephalus microplus TaxID=6941 RepID=A0A9J6CUA0_RHIMP|nr:hypothetical protein HPB51_029605 [Rhipicephalus microplus]
MEIEKATRGQADNPTWHFERNMRLTASNFYAVCRRRVWTPCDTLVKTLLYKKNFTSAALEHAWKTTGTCRTSVIRARNGNCCATLRVICLPRVRILGGVARRINCERRYRGAKERLKPSRLRSNLASSPCRYSINNKGDKRHPCRSSRYIYIYIYICKELQHHDGLLVLALSSTTSGSSNLLYASVVLLLYFYEMV